MSSPSQSPEKTAPPEDVNTLLIRDRWFFREARYSLEYLHDFDFEKEKGVLTHLEKQDVDVFTFVERTFIHRSRRARCQVSVNFDKLAVLKIPSFDDWWASVGKKTRNLVRKSKKKGVLTRTLEMDDQLIRQLHRIYNESPIRQGRRYIGYGTTCASLKKRFEGLQSSELIGAFREGRLIGFLHILCGDQAAWVRTAISSLEERKLSPNNALMAKGVERCSRRGISFLVWGTMGYLPTLDQFKKNNGFKKTLVPRYFVPLTARGSVAIRLGIHREIKHSIPAPLVRPALAGYSVAGKILPHDIWIKYTE